MNINRNDEIELNEKIPIELFIVLGIFVSILGPFAAIPDVARQIRNWLRDRRNANKVTAEA